MCRKIFSTPTAEMTNPPLGITKRVARSFMGAPHRVLVMGVRSRRGIVVGRGRNDEFALSDERRTDERAQERDDGTSSLHSVELTFGNTKALIYPRITLNAPEVLGVVDSLERGANPWAGGISHPPM